jgi:uncharacterized NAD-dependent epimerase/dehydratase family protein
MTRTETETAAGGFPEGRAIVYCQGTFGTTNGKTAHGLVRRTRRYEVLSVVDRRHAGRDAGEVLDGEPRGVPVVADLASAIADAEGRGRPATHLVVGLAPDGGRLPAAARADVLEAIGSGLHVDSGLHDYLSEDPELSAAARRSGVVLRDVRKPPDRSELHFFCGKIEQVRALKVALLGTDSAVGKRTTAWLLIDALERQGLGCEMIGTGQTAWMQGVRYGVIVDSLINDFVAGEIEHAVWSAWEAGRPDVIVLEGQGSLMNPAYPGGFELLAAGRPDAVVLQHAPARQEYDGFPGYPLHPLDRQIAAIELLSAKPVIAVALNHEGLDRQGIDRAAARIRRETGLPVCDPLLDGAGELAEAVLRFRRHPNALAAARRCEVLETSFESWAEML